MNQNNVAGNDNLYELLSNDKQYVLRFDLRASEGNVSYAEYDDFKVLSAADNYNLASVGNYSGDAGSYA